LASKKRPNTEKKEAELSTISTRSGERQVRRKFLPCDQETAFAKWPPQTIYKNNKQKTENTVCTANVEEPEPDRFFLRVSEPKIKYGTGTSS
jgi:hypothetical protein